MGGAGAGDRHRRRPRRGRVGDRLEMFVTTQAPYMDLEETSNILGIGRDQVRIIPSACGGGFGSKLDQSV